jgi:hypothetical protein
MTDTLRRCHLAVGSRFQDFLAAASLENTLGWKDVGRAGSKRACLSYIDEVCTDMRPLSLRAKMAKDVRKTR